MPNNIKHFAIHAEDIPRARTFYEKTFGGKSSFITIGESPMASSVPPEAHGRVMHVTLQIGDQTLQGADAPVAVAGQPCRVLRPDREAWSFFAAGPGPYWRDGP